MDLILKNKWILVGVIAASLIGWAFFPSRYDRLIGRALKLQSEFPELKVFDGETEPLFPDENENNRSLLGVDKNKNGIRDDVDIWINRMALDSGERAAMRSYARANQEKMRICESGLKSESLIPAACPTTKEQIDLLTFSTKKRIECVKIFASDLLPGKCHIKK